MVIMCTELSTQWPPTLLLHEKDVGYDRRWRKSRKKRIHWDEHYYILENMPRPLNLWRQWECLKWEKHTKLKHSASTVVHIEYIYSFFSVQGRALSCLAVCVTTSAFREKEHVKHVELYSWHSTSHDSHHHRLLPLLGLKPPTRVLQASRSWANISSCPQLSPYD